MDICVLNQFFHPYKGGTEKVLFEIYRRMAKRHNITVITSAPQGSKRNIVEEIEGITVIRLKSTHVDIPVAPLPFVAMRGLNSAIKKAHCELYHINNRYQYFGDNVAAIRKVGGRIALTIHNSLPVGIEPAIDSLGLVYDITWGRILMHEADLLTGVSRNTIDTTVPKRDIGKAHLIYNGVDYNLFRPIGKNDKKVKSVAMRLGNECESNDANIVTNGRLVEQKGAGLPDKGYRRACKGRKKAGPAGDRQGLAGTDALFGSRIAGIEGQVLDKERHRGEGAAVLLQLRGHVRAAVAVRAGGARCAGSFVVRDPFRRLQSRRYTGDDGRLWRVCAGRGCQPARGQAELRAR